MTTKSAIITLIVAVAGLATLLGGYCIAGEKQQAPAIEVLKKNFPNLKVAAATESPIKGLYEVEAGPNIIYFYPEQNLLIFGEIWTKEGKSLTAQRQAQMTAAKLKDMPLNKAVKIGNGKNVVIEFTDPDCPYCRKASAFFKGRTDVTRYVFLFPLPMHKESDAHARYVLCAGDRVKALEEVMSGQLDGTMTAPACPEPSADALLREHKELAAKMGLRGTPAFWVNGHYIAGANMPAIQALLDQKVQHHTKK